MPKHEDMDFNHAPAWCDDCWNQEVQIRMITEIRRSNDLKERELLERQDEGWAEPKPRPQPKFILPPPQKIRRGGMNVSPRG